MWGLCRYSFIWYFYTSVNSGNSLIPLSARMWVWFILWKYFVLILSYWHYLNIFLTPRRHAYLQDHVYVVCKKCVDVDLTIIDNSCVFRMSHFLLYFLIACFILFHQLFQPDFYFRRYDYFIEYLQIFNEKWCQIWTRCSSD